MLERRAGVILNIASVAGFRRVPEACAYTTSKGAVMQLTRSIAVDYARAGIRCNALCPGMIETPMTQWRLDQPDLRAQVLSHIPQNEIGTVDDVAAAAEFLVSDAARYVKRHCVGSRWSVDGSVAIHSNEVNEHAAGERPRYRANTKRRRDETTDPRGESNLRGKGLLAAVCAGHPQRTSATLGSSRGG